MNVLVVFAHPSPTSFNAALKDAAVETLRQAGHEVEISDLYAMAFKAAADGADFPAPVDPENLNYAAEQAAAYQSGTTAADLKAEQAKLGRADLVFFQFPLWWYSAPAILKGWLERVMSMGFAYGAGRMFDQGGLGGTKAMLSFTTHGFESSYAEDGWHGPMTDVLTPLHQGLRFVGFDILPPFVAYNVLRCSDTERAAMIDDLKKQLVTLPETAVLPYPPLAAYDDQGRRRRES